MLDSTNHWGYSLITIIQPFKKQNSWPSIPSNQHLFWSNLRILFETIIRVNLEHYMWGHIIYNLIYTDIHVNFSIHYRQIRNSLGGFNFPLAISWGEDDSGWGRWQRASCCLPAGLGSSCLKYVIMLIATKDKELYKIHYDPYM